MGLFYGIGFICGILRSESGHRGWYQWVSGDLQDHIWDLGSFIGLGIGNGAQKAMLVSARGIWDGFRGFWDCFM